MAFSKKYKTLGDVLLAYKIRHIKQKFKITYPVTAPQYHFQTVCVEQYRV
jgi:hypothetical protein